MEYLNSTAGVLTGTKEEGPIHERIPVEHVKGFLAERTRDLRLVLTS